MSTTANPVATAPPPATDLPRWDMTVVYPAVASPEFAAGFAAVIERIDHLAALFDAEGVEQDASASVDAARVTSVERVLTELNVTLDQVETLGAYLAAFVSTDSRDDLAQAKLSELEQHEVRLSKLATRFTAWIGGLDVDALIEQSPLAAAHAFPLRKTKRAATHLMTPAEEALAAELNPAAGLAWGKLHDNLTSQIAVPLTLDGEARSLSMSEVRNLAYAPDRDVRKRAHDAELAAWSRDALPLAAAMNGIKGHVNTLTGRRGWETPLDEALFINNIDRQTLDALLGAAREAFPRFTALSADQSPCARCSQSPLVRSLRTGWRRQQRLELGRGGSSFSRSNSAPTASGCVRWRPGPSVSGGSTPDRARASRVAPSACGCAATSRAFSQTTRRHMMASPPWPTSSVTPTIISMRPG